jgi:hypothetical protein
VHIKNSQNKAKDDEVREREREQLRRRACLSVCLCDCVRVFYAALRYIRYG